LLNLAKAELPSPPAQRPAQNPPSQISWRVGNSERIRSK
jgi:hypothetical protein